MSRLLRTMLVASLAGALLALGVSQAFAVSGLIINAPSNVLVNNTATYHASANANILITETITQAVFTFPRNTDVSGATVTLSRGTPSVTIDSANHRVTINTSATYVLGLGNPFVATVNNVVNPSEPGGYTYSVSITGNNTVSGTSATYTLLANGTVPAVGPVTLADSHESVVTTTTVPVKVGGNGRLEATAQPGGVTTPNKIYITFPLGYTVPSSPAASSVTVNDTTLSVAPSVSGREVTIRIPSGVSVAKNTTATVVFLPSFGMSNPSAGSYIAQGSTSAETGPGFSAIYTVSATPTTLTVSSANQPAGMYVLPSAITAVDGFTMQRNASSSSVGVSSVTIEDTGTTPSSTVSAVDVLRDDGDGVYDSGDTKLNTTAATFTGSSATVSFTVSEAVTTAGEQYWVRYTFSSGAADGASASSRVSALAHTADALANSAGVGSTMLVDAVPPAAPTASASAVSTAAIDVSWNAVTDSISGLDYYAVRHDDGSLVSTTTSTMVRVSGLSSATEYGFYVEAVDRVGHVSRSNTATATTFVVDLFISQGLASGSYSGNVTGAAHRLTGVGFDKFQITDAAGVGWNVTVQATPFVNRDGSGRDIAAGSFWMPALAATPVGSSPPAPPGEMAAPATIDGPAVLVQNCDVGQGHGVYDFDAPGASWGLDVAADQFAGTYDSTVTLTLSSGYR